MVAVAIQEHSDSELEAQLQRILAAECFQSAPQLSALLSYLVERTMAGQFADLKAAPIAQTVFKRDESFDAQTDTIVRVEAGRLRRRLAEYYREEGEADPVVIDIPKGGYRAVFSQRQTVEPVTGSRELQESAPAQKRTQGRRQYPSAGIAGVIGLLLVATWVLLYTLHAGNDPVASALEPVVTDSKPYIVVMPITTASMDEQSVRLAAGLVEALITNFSKISGLSVMAHASVLDAQDRQSPYSIQDFRSEFGVTHLLRGTMERQGDDVLLYVQLVDAKNAKVLWAERLSRHLDQVHDLREALATSITTELAVQLQPGEQTRLSQHHSATAESWLLYRQGLITIMPPRDLARIQAARQLFDRALEVAPDFAGGYTGLSFSHSTRALFMNSDDPAGELAQAVELANRAIAQDPNFGAGHAMLAFAQVLAGDSQAALDSVATALDIQPGDSFARFVLGMSLVLSGQPAAAISQLQEALRLDPVEPRRPYLNVLGIAYYTAADYSGALGILEDSYERGGPQGPHMDVFIAAAMAQLGEEDNARAVIARIHKNYPDFPLRAWLERWVTDPQQLSKTVGILQSLGLNLE